MRTEQGTKSGRGHDMLVVLVPVKVQGINAAGALVVFSFCMNEGRVASLSSSFGDP